VASILIAGGTVTTASEQYVADVFVDDGVIVQIGANLEVAADIVVSAEGQYVIPGGIDVHTHLGETVFRTITADSWESGTVAAAFGGTTTVVDFARQERDGMSPIEAIEHRRRQAEPQAVIDYGFHPPTVYFPLIVEEALMIEPTETEPPEAVEALAEAMIAVAKEAESDPDVLHGAPWTAPIGRLDEATAARRPVLRWTESS